MEFSKLLAKVKNGETVESVDLVYSRLDAIQWLRSQKTTVDRRLFILQDLDNRIAKLQAVKSEVKPKMSPIRRKWLTNECCRLIAGLGSKYREAWKHVSPEVVDLLLFADGKKPEAKRLVRLALESKIPRPKSRTNGFTPPWFGSLKNAREVYLSSDQLDWYKREIVELIQGEGSPYLEDWRHITADIVKSVVTENVQRELAKMLKVAFAELENKPNVKKSMGQAKHRGPKREISEIQWDIEQLQQMFNVPA